jgi:hypothetical protein
MANEILPYIEMCRREGVSLQRGMNYGLGGNHSVILMSVPAHRMPTGLNHFNHIIPWSKAGSSSTPDNIQLLCGKHNLEKHDRIE